MCGVTTSLLHMPLCLTYGQINITSQLNVLFFSSLKKLSVVETREGGWRREQNKLWCPLELGDENYSTAFPEPVK
jgi:hypothetical protein